jgi:PAS domain-containing protein
MVVGRVVVAGMVLSLVGTLAVAAALGRLERVPGLGTYRVLLAVGAAWIGTSLLRFLVFDPQLHRLLQVPQYGLGGLAAVVWLLFALIYTGRGRQVTPTRTGLLLAIPAVSSLVVVTNPGHHLMWRSYEVVQTGGLAGATYTYGPWYFAYFAFAYATIVVGLVLVVAAAAFSRGLYTRQVVALAIAVVCPTVINLTWVLRVGPLSALDLTPISFVLSSLLVGYALLREDLFDIVPATKRFGTRTAIDDVGDVVAIVDREGLVVDANTAAAELFDRPERELVGAELGELLGTPSFEPEDRTVTIETDAGRREFSLTVAPIADHHDRVVGHTVTLADITAEKHRRQRLEVLNRVVRHNIRNRMTVITGNAKLIRAEVDGDRPGDGGPVVEDAAGDVVEDAAEKIVANAADLTRLSEQASRVDRVFEVAREHQEVDLLAVVERVAASLSDDSISVTVDVPRDTRFHSPPEVVENVLSAAGRALLDAHDGDRPTLSLVAREDDGWISIAVTSDGPGVDERERRVVASGTETQLRHAEDLSLWLVKWGVETLGGEYAFEDEDGTEGVFLELPTAASEDTGRRVDRTDPRDDDAPRDHPTSSG